ncbi:SDR family NAD(P)-dependent oxidoreductase [Streptomyces sp. NPDC097610]|uniref:SDR family NAD(P)-dependent oxidoreductase n=1 Tax=Streptomyces sp. NPDC097610 TaxID=3157227 RepID=UPI0033293D03
MAKEIRAAGSACLDIAAEALDPRAAADVVTASVTEYGSLDVALLNAGQRPYKYMDQVSVADIARIMALNYDIVVNYPVPLIGQMGGRPNGGLITRTNSLAGLMGIPARTRTRRRRPAQPFRISQDRAARHVVRPWRGNPRRRTSLGPRRRWSTPFAPCPHRSPPRCSADWRRHISW